MATKISRQTPLFVNNQDVCVCGHAYVWVCLLTLRKIRNEKEIKQKGHRPDAPQRKVETR